MQFAFILSCFMMISAVLAAPSGHVFMRASCQIGKCVAALAPTVVSCAGAAAQEGANPIADAACLAGAVNAAVNLPASCDTCLDEFDVEGKLKSAGSKIKDVAEDVGDEVSDVAGSVKDKLGSIF